MTVKELREKLEELPGHLEVFASRDAEGNGFNSVYTVQAEMMDENNDVYAPEDYMDHEDDLRMTVVIWG